MRTVSLERLHQILSAFKHMFRLVLRSYRVCFMELHISDFSEHSLNCEGFHRCIALKLKVLEHIRTCQNVIYMYHEHIQKSHVILLGRYFFSQKSGLQVPVSPIHLKRLQCTENKINRKFFVLIS